jgi:hypothetical protein
MKPTCTIQKARLQDLCNSPSGSPKTVLNRRELARSVEKSYQTSRAAYRRCKSLLHRIPPPSFA